MEHCIVRRAIKSTTEDKILGYELVYRADSDCYFNDKEREDTEQDAITSFLIENSEIVAKDKRIFLNFTPMMLLKNTPAVFDNSKIVIQITDNLLVHPQSMVMVEKFWKEGYQFAINGFNFTPKYIRLLEYASYIRVEIHKNGTSRENESLENVVKMAKGFGKTCIVAGIDTKELYDKFVHIGADYLVGDYLAETMAVKEQKLSYMEGNFFQLLMAVSKDEPDMEELERIISRDAGLAYMLLKLVNSAYFALRRRTGSIRQALMTMGVERLRQWVYMLSRKKQAGEGSDEILRMSLLRAKIAENIAIKGHIKEMTPTEAHLMGMFSTLPYMVNASMGEILKSMPVKEEIKKALENHEGEGGDLINLIISYEKADWGECLKCAERLNLDIKDVSQAYAECLEEVSKIWDQLTTEYGEAEA